MGAGPSFDSWKEPSEEAAVLFRLHGCSCQILLLSGQIDAASRAGVCAGSQHWQDGVRRLCVTGAGCSQGNIACMC